MFCIETEVILKNDIDGRAANRFVYSIASMPFNVKIHKGDKQVNGKSILGLLSIGLKSGVCAKICSIFGFNEDIFFKSTIENFELETYSQ